MKATRTFVYMLLVSGVGLSVPAFAGGDEPDGQPRKDKRAGEPKIKRVESVGCSESVPELSVMGEGIAGSAVHGLAALSVERRRKQQQ